MYRFGEYFVVRYQHIILKGETQKLGPDLEAKRTRLTTQCRKQILQRDAKSKWYFCVLSLRHRCCSLEAHA
jgi:hypothetical protein